MKRIIEELLEQLGTFLSEHRYAELSAVIRTLEPADIALLFEEVGISDVVVLFRLLPKDLAADTFVELETEQQAMLIRAFSDAELRMIVEELYLDDTVDLIEEMPANVVRRIIASVSEEDRGTINTLLQFPSDSAGSIMTTEFVSLRRQMTAEEALAHIRRTGYDKETVYTCYVIDENRYLVGVVTVRDLLFRREGATIDEIMNENVISCTTSEDKREVARTLDKYDFLALPVVDSEKRLVGIVTVDDAIDVLTDEATEDMEKMAKIVPMEKDYLHATVFETWKQRIPWLLLLMISATFTGKIITAAEDALSAYVVLTAFIPMLMDTGGNAGGQVSVTVIRGLSLGEITFSDWARVLLKEIGVSIFCGLTLACVNFAKLLWIDRVSMQIAFVVCITLLITVLIAKIVGCLLPIGAKRLGFDPAVMASPFITTIVDALALLSYFRIAQLLLHIG